MLWKIQEERYQELSLIRVLIKGKGTTNVIVNIKPYIKKNTGRKFNGYKMFLKMSEEEIKRLKHHIEYFFDFEKYPEVKIEK